MRDICRTPSFKGYEIHPTKRRAERLVVDFQMPVTTNITYYLNIPSDVASASLLQSILAIYWKPIDKLGSKGVVLQQMLMLFCNSADVERSFSNNNSFSLVFTNI